MANYPYYYALDSILAAESQAPGTIPTRLFAPKNDWTPPSNDPVSIRQLEQDVQAYEAAQAKMAASQELRRQAMAKRLREQAQQAMEEQARQQEQSRQRAEAERLRQGYARQARERAEREQTQQDRMRREMANRRKVPTLVPLPDPTLPTPTIFSPPPSPKRPTPTIVLSPPPSPGDGAPVSNALLGLEIGYLKTIARLIGVKKYAALNETQLIKSIMDKRDDLQKVTVANLREIASILKIQRPGQFKKPQLVEQILKKIGIPIDPAMYESKGQPQFNPDSSEELDESGDGASEEEDDVDITVSKIREIYMDDITYPSNNSSIIALGGRKNVAEFLEANQVDAGANESYNNLSKKVIAYANNKGILQPEIDMAKATVTVSEELKNISHVWQFQTDDKNFAMNRNLIEETLGNPQSYILSEFGGKLGIITMLRHYNILHDPDESSTELINRLRVAFSNVDPSFDPHLLPTTPQEFDFDVEGTTEEDDPTPSLPESPREEEEDEEQQPERVGILYTLGVTALKDVSKAMGMTSSGLGQFNKDNRDLLADQIMANKNLIPELGIGKLQNIAEKVGIKDGKDYKTPTKDKLANRIMLLLEGQSPEQIPESPDNDNNAPEEFVFDASETDEEEQQDETEDVTQDKVIVTIKVKGEEKEITEDYLKKVLEKAASSNKNTNENAARKLGGQDGLNTLLDKLKLQAMGKTNKDKLNALRTFYAITLVESRLDDSWDD